MQGLESITDTALVKNHHICGLGQWRDSEGHQFDSLAEMQTLDDAHERYHALVAQVIELANAENLEAAYALMEDADKMSTEVVELMSKLEYRISNDGLTRLGHYH